MKKIMIILGFSAALLACSKVTEPVDSSAPACPITLNLSIGSGSPDTKGIKKEWDNNDKVHIFFQDYVNSDYQYLTVAYNKSAGTWYAHTWHGGLDKKLRISTSGRLSAIYYPNDKVGGSMSVLQPGDIDEYTITPTDRSGKVFNSYYSYDDAIYNIDESGVLSATINLTSMGTYTQYCIERDRNGVIFTNADSDHYTLQVSDIVYHSPTSQIYKPSFNGDSGELRNTLEEVVTYLSAYFYGGLCFSDLSHGTGASKDQTLIFVFNDNRGDRNTTNDKKYVYSVKYRYFMPRAVKLPDLNATDANGNYLWTEL